MMHRPMVVSRYFPCASVGFWLDHGAEERTVPFSFRWFEDQVDRSTIFVVLGVDYSLFFIYPRCIEWAAISDEIILFWPFPDEPGLPHSFKILSDRFEPRYISLICNTLLRFSDWRYFLKRPSNIPGRLSWRIFPARYRADLPTPGEKDSSSPLGYFFSAR